MVRARQVVIVETGKVEVQEVELPDPQPDQILVAASIPPSVREPNWQSIPGPISG
jgi:hypothetical protein